MTRNCVWETCDRVSGDWETWLARETARRFETALLLRIEGLANLSRISMAGGSSEHSGEMVFRKRSILKGRVGGGSDWDSGCVWCIR
jgi:hypothetical protein